MTRAAALLAALIAAAGCSGPATSTAPGGGDLVDVAAVADGDSLRLVDGAEVRLLGINAPELDECHGPEARAALESLLAGAAIELEEAGGDSADRFGRLLRYVVADGVVVNDVMVEQGHALALSDGNSRADVLAAAEVTAHAQGRGMWAPDACGPPSAAEVRIDSVAADPPGEDGLDLNGESVTIVNDGDAAVDLGGWTLRDESSVHRYRMGAQAGLPPSGTLTVRVGCGPDSAAVLHMCSDGPVWNNGGDTALLLDPHGNVVSRFSY